MNPTFIEEREMRVAGFIKTEIILTGADSGWLSVYV
jgi:hypothetical protein